MFDLLGGVALQGVGGILGSLLNSGDSVFEGSQSAGVQAANQLLPAQQQATLNALYSSSGTGQNALNAFNNAYRAQGPSAEAMAGYGQQQALASSMLGQADRSFNMAADAAQRQQRALLTNARDAARRQGGSVASLAGLSATMGDQGMAGIANLQNQSGQQMAGATGAAANMLSGAASMITDDTAKRYQFMVEPLAVRDSGTGAATMNQYGNVMNNAAQSAAETRLMTDPMAGISAGLGSIGSQFANNFFDQRALNQANNFLRFTNPYV